MCLHIKTNLSSFSFIRSFPPPPSRNNAKLIIPPLLFLFSNTSHPTNKKAFYLFLNILFHTPKHTRHKEALLALPCLAFPSFFISLSLPPPSRVLPLASVSINAEAEAEAEDEDKGDEDDHDDIIRGRRSFLLPSKFLSLPAILFLNFFFHLSSFDARIGLYSYLVFLMLKVSTGVFY